MATLYKLTTQDWLTRPGMYNECKWGPGISHRGTGKGDLCSPGYIHAYLSPELAVLLNPIHARYENPVLWECEGNIAINKKDLKVGCVELKTIKLVDLPILSNEQIIYFGILCALEVYTESSFVLWAENWINNNDRSTDAARYAAHAVDAALRAANAAHDALADSAAHAAYAARYAAHAATYVAYAATYVAHVATYVAHVAHAAHIDFPTLAKKAVTTIL